MKILHISTSDKSGGAAIAAFRLHNAMLSSGIDSKYLVLDRKISDRLDIISVSKYSRHIHKVINMIFEKITIRNMHKMNGLFSSFRYGIKISKRKEIVEADIIYLHWVNLFVNFCVLKNILKTGKPVFWFMHDMFAITGGCHYSFDCVEYQTQCRKCQYHKSGLHTDLSERQYKIKGAIYKKNNNLMFITPSKWLLDCAIKSGLTQNRRIYHIPNLIDTKIFKPVQKEFVRKLFGLDHNTKIIGFGADSALSNPYKGWNYLKSALDHLSKDESLHNTKIEVLIFGSSYSKEIANNIPFPVHFLGHLYDEFSLVLVYNCMDVFVIPSFAENFPNTILESLSCGIPVIGFNTGGIPDMVNENTGYLVEYKNSNNLAKGISLILKNGKNNVFEHVMPYAPEEVVNRHINMWNIENIMST